MKTVDRRTALLGSAAETMDGIRTQLAALVEFHRPGKIDLHATVAQRACVPGSAESNPIHEYDVMIDVLEPIAGTRKKIGTVV